MTSTIVATKKFTVNLTKAELDSIQKQLLNDLDEIKYIFNSLILKLIKNERRLYDCKCFSLLFARMF